MFQIIVICAIVGILINASANEVLQPLTPEYLITINIITFFIYGWDKLTAVMGWWRVMEFTLHILSLIGGWPAALIAQLLFRHKLRKVRFQLIFWSIVVLHMIGIYFLFQQSNKHRHRWY